MRQLAHLAHLTPITADQNVTKITMPARRAAAAAAAIEPAAEESDEESEGEEAEIATGDAAIVYFYDFEKNDMVLDVRTMSELPFDPDASGVKAFRAFVFEKGKSMHAPDAPGKYIVAGNWYEQWSLSLVHFKESTKRKPELLLNFVDYGMLSVAMTGLSVESLALPLKLAKNIYNDTPRLTSVKDVAGFSPIDTGMTPWSTNLAACLKKLPLFVAHDVFMPIHLKGWLKKGTLASRINMLELSARKAIALEVEAMRKQDVQIADRAAALYVARLTKTIGSIRALPPQAYDVDERVIVLEPDAEVPLPTITTPTRKKILDGSSELLRTTLVARAAPIAPVAPRAQIVSPIREQTEAGDEDAGETREEDEEVEPGVTEIVAADVRIISRVRQPPSRYEVPAAAKSAKRKATTAADAFDAPDAWGINPRTQLPYVRRPYSVKMKGLNELKKIGKQAIAGRTAPDAPPASISSETAAAEKARAKEAGYKEKVSTLECRILTLEKDLAVLQANTEREKSDAFRKGADEAKMEVTRIIIESKEEYKKGLADGARLATGKSYTLAHQSRKSDSYSGSHGGGSSRGSFKRRAERSEHSESDD